MIKNFHDVAFKQIQTISNNFKLWANSNFPHDLFHKSIEASPWRVYSFPCQIIFNQRERYRSHEAIIPHMAVFTAFHQTGYPLSTLVVQVKRGGIDDSLPLVSIQPYVPRFPQNVVWNNIAGSCLDEGATGRLRQLVIVLIAAKIKRFRASREPRIEGGAFEHDVRCVKTRVFHWLSAWIDG